MKISARSLEKYQVEISSGNHVYRSDEPISDGGDDAGPNPYALLLGALGACKVITVRMYAQRKGWPLEDVEVDLSTYKVHAKDCEDCESDPNAKVDIVECEIRFKGDLTAEQIKRLKEISERCPVHRTMTSETKIRTVVPMTLAS